MKFRSQYVNCVCLEPFYALQSFNLNISHNFTGRFLLRHNFSQNPIRVGGVQVCGRVAPEHGAVGDQGLVHSNEGVASGFSGE